MNIPKFMETKKRSIILAVFALVIVSLVLFPMRSGPNNTAIGFTTDYQTRALEDVEASCTNQSYVLPEGVGSQNADDAFDLEEAVFTIPPNSEGPTVVDIGLYIIQITEISEVDNTFQLEAFMDLVWCDPRLAYNPEEIGLEKEVFLEEEAAIKLGRIWWPDVTFVNEAGRREIENEIVTIYPDGTVDYEERFHATLEGHYDLRKFPFDAQELEIEVESFAWSSDELVFHEESNKIGFSADFQIPEWRTENVRAEIKEKQEIRDRVPFSEFILYVDVVREAGFYIWKIVIPLILLVAISWSVFWMIGDGLADRMSVSLTGILTVVAYQFIITESLPRVNYFTWIDGILSLSFVMMGLTIVENVYVNVLYLQDKNATANRVDHICRWLFPLAYFGFMAILSIRDFL